MELLILPSWWCDLSKAATGRARHHDAVDFGGGIQQRVVVWTGCFLMGTNTLALVCFVHLLVWGTPLYMFVCMTDASWFVEFSLDFVDAFEEEQLLIESLHI